MTETPQEDKGYTGDDASDLGNAADEKDVQTAPAGEQATSQPDEGDEGEQPA